MFAVHRILKLSHRLSHNCAGRGNFPMGYSIYHRLAPSQERKGPVKFAQSICVADSISSVQDSLRYDR